MKYAFLGFPLFSFFLSAQAGKIFYPTLKPAQCLADPESKTYTSDLNDTLLVKYKCRYTCLDNHEKNHSIWIEHTFIKTPNTDEMTDMVCHGVSIEVKKSALGYVLDQDIYVAAIWAPFSENFKNWVRENSVHISADDLQSLRKTMNQTFMTMGKQLYASGNDNPAIAELSRALLEIASGTDLGESILGDILKKNKNHAELNQYELLLSFQLKTHGFFLFL